MNLCDGTNPMRKPTIEDGYKRDHEKKQKRAKIKAKYTKKRIPKREKIGVKLADDVRDRDGDTCQKCFYVAGERRPDGSIVKTHIDHTLAVKHGGTNCESNLRVLCDRCNLGRGTKRDFKAEARARQRTPDEPARVKEMLNRVVGGGNRKGR